jgi:hypothetical protein
VFAYRFAEPFQPFAPDSFNSSMIMTTTFEFAVVAVLLSLVVLATLVFGGRYVHAQMEGIAETAAAGSPRAAGSDAAEADHDTSFVPVHRHQ